MRKLPFAGTAVMAAVALAVALLLPSAAGATKTQFQMMQADPLVFNNPVETLAEFRALGANTVRVIVHWDLVAPSHDATHAPSGFNGADPNSYPANAWTAYDTIVQTAKQDHMTVDFTVAGGAPRWAEGKGIPPQYVADRNFAWKPSAKLYGQFLHAVAERYNGKFVPQGASRPLPRVNFWAIWNEPNFGQDLGPQAINGSKTSVGPMMYRALVDAGWKALQQTGHSHDTILIGGFAAEGRSGPVNRKHPQGLPGNAAQTKPLLYIPTLYCLGTNLTALRGRSASTVGCPTNAAGTRAFRAKHPGLFKASGVADHPYSGDRSPVSAKGVDKHFAIFSQLGNLERMLDRATAAYGAHPHYRIYSDEYGYITHPPQIAKWPSPATAAYYINWAEYLSWRSSRIASYAQYLLRDPPKAVPIGFTSGLEFADGKPKATYYAYRMPVYMPRTAVRKGASAEVWGAARPGHFMTIDGDGPQSVQIQFQPGGHGSYSTLRTVSANGYFDVRVPFPGAGNLRLAYTYPTTDPLLAVGFGGTTAYSRIVKLKLAR